MEDIPTPPRLTNPLSVMKRKTTSTHNPNA